MLLGVGGRVADPVSCKDGRSASSSPLPLHVPAPCSAPAVTDAPGKGQCIQPVESGVGRVSCYRAIPNG